MVPISRSAGVDSRSNGSANRVSEMSNVPPSTMAAQLINNLSTTNKPSRQQEQDELPRLMKEVSEFENNASQSQDVAIKLEYKHKLIYVFARAVIERLSKDDPFMNIEQVVSQASEALDIFIATIKENPLVLDYVLPSSTTLQGRGEEPLWSWLFPRVLMLLGRRKCESLTEKIKDFFYVSFQVISHSPKVWNLNSQFFTYLKECVRTTLDHLGDPSVLARGSIAPIRLPYGLVEDRSFLKDMNEESSNPVVLCNYTISSAAEGICHSTQLLSMLVDVSVAAASSFDATPAFQDYLVWMLESFLDLHHIHRKWQANPVLYDSCVTPDSISISAVFELLSSLHESLSDSIRRKGYNTLLVLCTSLLEHHSDLFSDTSMCITLCSSILNLAAMCKKYEALRRAAAVHFIPTLRIAMAEGGSESIGKDFKRSCAAIFRVCESSVTRNDDNGSGDFENEGLSAQFRRWRLQEPEDMEAENQNASDGPPVKRRRIGEEQSLLDEVTSQFYSTLLGSDISPTLVNEHQIAEESFAALSEADKCKAIACFGHIPCAASGFLTVTREDTKIKDYKCLLCETSPIPTFMKGNRETCEETGPPMVLTFTKLIKAEAFLNSRRARVLAMIVLRKFALHFDDADLLDLEVSPLGQWCLASLNSSIREMRLVAGRTLPAFLRCSLASDSLAKKNRFNTIDLLRSFATRGTHLQETCVLAWGQVGRVVKDDELTFVLLGLVSYLGHSNPVVSGVAFNEIIKLAEASRMSVERLFNPFWGIIAIEVVKDLAIRPQTTQLMADLIGLSVSEFLLGTQSYTIPWLVLNRNLGVIKRIKDARRDKEDWEMFLFPANLNPTIALLLTQNVPDMETFVMSSLRSVSSRFFEETLESILRLEPSTTALHLLKAAGEADDSKKSRIHFALQFLATHASPTLEDKQRKQPTVGFFLEVHMLGLIARLAEVITAPIVEQTLTEKERSVRAVEELVKLAKKHTRIARPHICACLQSAFAQKELQPAAFSAWETMLRNMDDADVESMLESTFSIVIQFWDSFNDGTRDRAFTILQYLVTSKARLIRNTIVNLPSLRQIASLSDIESHLNKMRTQTDVGNKFQIFSRRICHENAGVVAQALTELKEYLRVHQSFLQASAVSEQPDVVVAQLVRSILDTCVKFNGSENEIAQLSAECIGLVGCLDSNRVESVREQRDVVVVSNFEDAHETTEFVLHTLTEAIVPTFLSTADTVLQGFLSYIMQELLAKTGFSAHCADAVKHGDRDCTNDKYLRWLTLPISVQDTLTPFLTSKYSFPHSARKVEYKYPMFCPDRMPDTFHSPWLRCFVHDLLQKHNSIHTSMIFPPLCRAIKPSSLPVANFLLPYVALYVIVDGTDQNRKEIGAELLAILEYEIPLKAPQIRRDNWQSCLEAVFRVLDYLARWIQEKQAKSSSRSGDFMLVGIERVNSILELIPPEVISARAVECKSYSRALFYWEQHIRQVRAIDKSEATNARLLQHLQDIYTQIDEPDGIEGISAHLHVLDIDQQILAHRKAGRWTAVQSWYEIQLAEKPKDMDVQLNLLTCLKESGQHDVLLNYVEGMDIEPETTSRILPFAAEASWATGRWKTLEKYTDMASKANGEEFNVSLGRSLLFLHKREGDLFKSSVRDLREQIARTMSASTTSSLRVFHDSMLKLHALAELEMIAGTDGNPAPTPVKIMESLDRRLEVIGAYINDKQYLLGIRRAAMQLSSLEFGKAAVASAWLTSARLARKDNSMHQSFNAVLHASQLGDKSATIEHSRLLWKNGHYRKAIQILQGAIETNAFISNNQSLEDISATTLAPTSHPTEQQNVLSARAHLLLAKWLDSAGQTHSSALRTQYQLAARTYLSWEKGHYYLGRHYNKLLETEKALPPEQQNETFLTGETAKLVIENYLRALTYGTKYIYQTLPRILTLWLDLGIQVNQKLDERLGNSREFIQRITSQRKTHLDSINSRFSKYVHKIPAYMFYTALPQIMSRIAHPNNDVYKYLQLMIIKVVSAFPQQALWSLLAVCTSCQNDRKMRGATILQSIRTNKKIDTGTIDIRSLVKNGERISEQLLLACNAGEFRGNRTIWASLSRDLSFNSKICLPSSMAVPVESVLTATLPTLTDNVKSHKAFSRDVVTIDSFLDEVMVLSSLQKPRKLTARGSDGRLYGIMCKPKDDLRKDQRLMEFNSMINRSLKRDAESSKRQLYIKTYAVTPLNEECGLIEWVDGLKTLRDILLGLYKPIGIQPHYKDIELLCDQATKSEEKLPLFSKQVLGMFPPIFHKWFVQQFPEPSTWFGARLRYTRSCAVMSMVGTILGLGDRHGENILFEEGNGGTFHVDFNCLFDKGLTFVKPERVPFRLTHNMIDAMGMYGYEGPFRQSSELTLKLLRQHEETLMTILEAFVYDPTLDLLANKPEKKKKSGSFAVPQTAQGVLDSIQRKVRGLLAGESVPLGVEGQVDELIKQATNQTYLAGMYIGWCAFL